MLATINCASNSNVCKLTNRNTLAYSEQRNRTSFLIRDILGKSEEVNSDSEVERDLIKTSPNLHSENVIKPFYDNSSKYSESISSNSDLEDKYKKWYRRLPKNSVSAFSKDCGSINNHHYESRSPAPTLCCRECSAHDKSLCNLLKNDNDDKCGRTDDEELSRDERLSQSHTCNLEPIPRDFSFDQGKNTPFYKIDRCKSVSENYTQKGEYDKASSLQENFKYFNNLKKRFNCNDSDYSCSPVNKRSVSGSFVKPAECVKDYAESHSDGEINQPAERKQNHKLNSIKAGNDLWTKRRGNMAHDSVSGELYPTQEQNERGILDKLRESTIYNHPLYNGIFINPVNPSNMIDLSYAYNLRAAALVAPHIALPWINFNSLNATLQNNKQASNLRLEESVKYNARDGGAQPLESYPRYKLNDWPQETGVHGYPPTPRSLLHAQFRHQSVSPGGNDRFNESTKRNESSRASSTQPDSPVFNEMRPISPSPDRQPIQLPAYLRSRLGETSPSNDRSNRENGKLKKCRRSRTVFTELQMLGLEKRFEKQQYLSTPDRVELAELLGLSQLQVKTWYQNRRMKWKKQVMQGGGTEPPTKPKGRPRKVRPEEQNVSKSFVRVPDVNRNVALDLRASADLC